MNMFPSTLGKYELLEEIGRGTRVESDGYGGSGGGGGMQFN